MVDELEHKHEVKVQSREGRQKLPDSVKEILKGSGMMDEKGKLKLKGVSPKMLKRMKQEFVDCPVLKEEIHFIPYLYTVVLSCLVELESKLL